MFWDLNIPYPTNIQVARDIIATAIHLGYDGIVWSRVVDHKLTPKDVNAMVPIDIDAKQEKDIAQTALLRPGAVPGFRQKFRLTVLLNDISQVHSLVCQSNLRARGVAVLSGSHQRCCEKL